MTTETIALAVALAACVALLSWVLRLRGRERGRTGALSTAVSAATEGPRHLGHREPDTAEPDTAEPDTAEPDTALPGAEHLADPEALPDVPDSVPDSVVDGARFGHLTVRAAATRGEAARSSAQVRRQAVALAILESFDPPVLLSAVAAGHPTGRRSQLGAAQACRSVQHKLSDAAADLDAAWLGMLKGDEASGGQLAASLLGVLRAVVDPMTEAARWRGLELDAIATELTCVLSRLGDGPSRSHIAFGVGTGPVLILRPGGLLAPVLATAHEGTGPRPALLPMTPEALWWSSFETAPGDVALACTASTATLLRRDGFSTDRTDEFPADPPSLIRFLAQLSTPDKICREDRAAVGLWETRGGRRA